uniref:Glycosyltransferase involved in cell wall bisynthesis n=1 Tax=Candidatus Kentrum sp. MB TaxID=2138164 RepID=A0A450XI23_9GAMM|nr:MAG: Glycosyltransferase involved in cell wall bisynthesis [Candidatus Kentron sp. MB]VFK33963.1 MAG: Glycosyltransferase involved in cell wall bisynthesis [Candidatus Kentron sp. MB]VFK76526.1 MAG: Glycosyltransferase involved in cell wall bisynthesis [Candidatus Kentron sp. MB]
MRFHDKSVHRNRSIDFSIIIPTFNTREFIADCLTSVFLSANEDTTYEVLVVDDCSTDQTREIVRGYTATHPNVILLKTQRTSGPGFARNLGVEKASGKWILYLDSDDCYAPNSLDRLKHFIAENRNTDLDVVVFDWAYHKKSDCIPHTTFEGRMDSQYFSYEKEEIVANYLQFRIDHSVIYTAVQRKLIIDHNIRFRAGYHEDVDYMFKVYWAAKTVRLFQRVLYLKTSRAGSIVNTISINHIKGFMHAYQEIYSVLHLSVKDRKIALEREFRLGLIGLVATRAREIYRNSSDIEQQAKLYEALYNEWITFEKSNVLGMPSYGKTAYSLICAHFLKTMADDTMSLEERTRDISAFFDKNSDKRWSCVDLHHSVFLRPNQIRTCCKRFFVDGEMKGDVVLLEQNDLSRSDNIPSKIVNAKKARYASINKGEATDCDGCPFLEFARWAPLGEFKIKTLSLEHHSVCNLKCTYCSEDYHGGSLPAYDVGALLENLLETDAISDKATVIWGGGEPVLVRDFSTNILSILRRKPQTIHRVITNAVSYSDTVRDLLSQGKIFIYTSVDAGAESGYERVHGRRKLRQVMENLRKYAMANAENITVKYLFTKGNCEIEELKAFVALVDQYGLRNCAFQISSDFKEEFVFVENLVLMVTLYKMLAEAGCSIIAFDELLRHRIGKFSESEKNLFLKQLEQAGALSILADPKRYDSVIVWGIGEYAATLIEKSMFFQQVHIDNFVLSGTGINPDTIYGKDVLPAETLLESNTPVVIAAVQNYSLIYRQFIELGLNKERLITKLIL